MKFKHLVISTLVLTIAGISSFGIINVIGASTFEKEIKDSKVIQMDKNLYKKVIFDFDKKGKKFAYNGKRPVVIDFYADWCRPCRMVAPIMDNLSEKYAGKVDFYKVNVDKENELAAFHNIQSIPVVAVFSKNNQPKLTTGALSIDSYIKIIDETLLKK